MAQRYKYSVDLRLRHPSADPRDLSRHLKMRPQVSWSVGDRRVTPSGNTLPGTRAFTYWSKTMTPRGVEVPPGQVAERVLTSLAKRLKRHVKFLKHHRKGGGTAEIWLSAYSSTNYSFVISPALIGSFHQLGCELIIDVFPYAQRFSA